MSERKLIIYCDESAEKGRFFSHFYGGALLDQSNVQRIENSLNDVKTQNNLNAELKWTKISKAYKGKYIAFLERYFDHIASGDIKVRIMFTQNSNEAAGLEDHQIGNQYWLLYYQLVKHAFGLMYCGCPPIWTRVSLYLDDIPDTDEKFSSFKQYVSSLNMFPKFANQRVYIPDTEIVNVNSKSHVILQGLDIILGAMQFRLNDKHKEIPEGLKRRAKRTVAKEEVYKYINSRIRDLYPNFNVGTSTAVGDDVANRWRHPYRHWLLVPSEKRLIVGFFSLERCLIDRTRPLIDQFACP
ncbi:DUF3800 domain-containing protein [Chenggangzhangella methanolivorans]|uniref:DUF3800 domain-containing protein n=1 Tax=Chenggangzhangella methanolivorans TaxID=1437009 RepID=A0A9E6RBC1_9HYPH|nr:DUF3800 domain-containing protein [Chenggangzhangella methanolivorans]QZO01619.1 DUF3800 domain-containing protein [Chenggangzhangella methanolivorans]